MKKNITARRAKMNRNFGRCIYESSVLQFLLYRVLIRRAESRSIADRPHLSAVLLKLTLRQVARATCFSCSRSSCSPANPRSVHVHRTLHGQTDIDETNLDPRLVSPSIFLLLCSLYLCIAV